MPKKRNDGLTKKDTTMLRIYKQVRDRLDNSKIEGNCLSDKVDNLLDFHENHATECKTETTN